MENICWSPTWQGAIWENIIKRIRNSPCLSFLEDGRVTPQGTSPRLPIDCFQIGPPLDLLMNSSPVQPQQCCDSASCTCELKRHHPHATHGTNIRLLTAEQIRIPWFFNPVMPALFPSAGPKSLRLEEIYNWGYLWRQDQFRFYLFSESPFFSVPVLTGAKSCPLMFIEHHIKVRKPNPNASAAASNR